ncbi:MAG: hypothetical protein OER88_01690, partial [Planctomycetota bacterium]|nr:hypothetical protein [Planctomycetota bacterium]
ALAREIGMRREEAHALRGLATVEEEEGSLNRSRELLEKARELFVGIDERGGAVGVMTALGLQTMLGGREDRAAVELDAALAEAREAGDRVQEVMAGALRACLAGGDAAEAVRLFTELRPTLAVSWRMGVAYYLFRATGEPRFLEDAREGLAVLRAGVEPDDAAALDEGLRLHREVLRGA